ncbi:MAG: regulatory protein RecX [Litorilinea sp.]|nr:MAG: regulatory protein RecX [Litorilinea sp.]
MAPTITALRVQKRNRERVNVYLDGEYAFAVNILTAARLKRGQELAEEEVARLRQEGERDLAYQRAVRFLGYRPRSRQELIRYLREKGYEADVIESTVARLEAQGFLDDQAFARFWVEDRGRFRPRSARALRQELREKGIEPSIIEQVLAGLDGEALAWAAVTQRLARWKGLPWEAFEKKVMGYLARRGFDYQVARTVCQRAWETVQDEES